MMMKGFTPLFAVIVGLAAVAAHGQYGNKEPKREVAFEQKLNEQVPGYLYFNDEDGKQVQLKDYYGDKPIALMLIQYNCPGICSTILDGVMDAFKHQQLSLGKDFICLTVSIDPTEKPALAAEKKKNYMQLYDRPDAAKGWHWLTSDYESIQRLADSIGFRYVYDAAAKRYAHPAGMVILTPEGKTSKYFFGIGYNNRDVKFALIEASDHKIGTAVDNLLIGCYVWDHATGKYTLRIYTLLKIAAALTIVGMALSIVVMTRKFKRTALTPDDLNKELEEGEKD